MYLHISIARKQPYPVAQLIKLFLNAIASIHHFLTFLEGAAHAPHESQRPYCHARTLHMQTP